MTNKVIVILGMHRSGTSALTGMLHNAGLNIGDDLISPKKEVNAKGFWESRSILEFNEKILSDFSLSWDSIFDSNNLNFTQKKLNLYANKLHSLIKDKFSKHQFWGFKEPRTCRLLKVWKYFFNKYNYDPIYLIIHRNPLEVAESLRKRDGFDVQHSMLLWILHYIDIIKNTKDEHRYFINFDELINNPISETSSLFNFLKLLNAGEYNTNCIDFLDKSLKHNLAENLLLKHESEICKSAIELYEILRNYNQNNTSNSDDEFDKFSNRFMSKLNIFSEILEYESKKIKTIRDSFINAENIIRKYENNNEETKKTLEEKDKYIKESQDVLNITKTQLKKSTEHINALETNLNKYETDYKNLEVIIKEKNKLINDYENYHDDLKSSYDNLDRLYNNLTSSIAQKDHQLINSQDAITKLNKQLSDNTTYIDSLKRHMSEFEIEHNSICEILKQKEKVIISDEKYREELYASYKNLEKLYEDATNNIAKKDKEITKTVKTVNSMEKNITESKKIIKEYELQLKNAQTIRDKALKDNANKDNLIDSLTNEITELKNKQDEILDNYQTMECVLNKNKIILNQDDDTPHENLSDNEYETELNILVENSSHSKMFRLIEEHSYNESKRILEVGCSTGFFGELLKSYNHTVWGIEIDPNTANVARKRIDHVYTGTIEDFIEEPELAQLEFDYIIFGDVLEHLVNPLNVLIKCQKLLSEKGAVIVSIPNIAHITTRTMLLTGKWEYSDCGIMDKTHLRFFTKDTLIDLFTDAGYFIDTLDKTIVTNEESDISIDTNLFNEINKATNDDEKEVFQYIALAKYSSDNFMISENKRFNTNHQSKILCLLPFEDWSIGNIRIKDPLTKYCSIYGGALRVLQSDKWTPDDIAWCDTIVFQREVNIPMLNLIEMFQKLNKRIIFDIDDLLTEVPSFLISHESCEQSKPYLIEALKMADAVTVTTNALKNELSEYSSHIHVVPNCSRTLFPPTKHYESNEPINILIASSDTVRVDFVYETLHRLLGNSQIKIKIIAIGPPGKALENEALPIEWHPTMTHDHFKAFLATLDNTIGVIPLDDSKFSSCKSAIKYLDYSLAGIPTICSDVLPYSEVVTNESTGILCNNNSDNWYNSIMSLITSIDKRSTISNEARNFVINNYSLKNSADCWNDMFSKTNPGIGQQGSTLVDISKFKKLSNFAKLLTKPRKYKEAFETLKNEGPSGIKQRITNFF